MKVLILSYAFPPVPLISAQRAYAFHKFLPREGIETVTVTRKWREGLTGHDDLYEVDSGKVEQEIIDASKVIRVPFKGNLKFRLVRTRLWPLRIIRKLITLLQTLLQWRFLFLGDYYPLYRESKHILRKEQVDCILVTGQPFVLFHYARLLSAKFDIPYFLDYRDGWFTSHLNREGVLQKWISKQQCVIESRILANALGVTTVSSGLLDAIRNQFSTSPQAKVITNGVDREIIEEVRHELMNNKSDTIDEHVPKFEVVYTGTLNDKKRVDILLQAFESFVQQTEHNDIVLKLVGISLRKNKYESLIAHYAAKYAWLEIVPPVPFRASLAIQMRSQVLVALIPGRLSDGIFTGKIFEYAACGRPIVVVENDENMTGKQLGADSENIGELDMYHSSTSEGLSSLLNNLYDQYKLNKTSGNSAIHYPAWITREYQVKQLAQFITQASVQH